MVQVVHEDRRWFLPEPPYVVNVPKDELVTKIPAVAFGEPFPESLRFVTLVLALLWIHLLAPTIPKPSFLPNPHE